MKTIIISLLAIVSVCWACKKNDRTIRIATKPMTEQFILGEMLGLLITEYAGLPVRITKGIGGGTSNIQPALLKGEFDMYPEYTGTGWNVVLKKNTMLPPEQMYDTLKKEYLKKYDLRWIAPYGFNNTYGLAVNDEKAKQYGLKNISDLAAYPGVFVFGAEYDFFEIPKGYDALCRHYDLEFKKTTDMDIGLKYEAMRSGKIDVMNVFTTDGQLSGAHLTVLDDDKRFFPSYYCATVVRQKTLSLHPELEKILMKMQDILTDSEMAELNYQVDVEGKSDRAVAAAYLKKKGLLDKNKDYGE